MKVDVGRLWKAVFEASGAKVVTLGLSMGTLALTARWLGPEGRGIIAVVVTWATLVATLGHLSLGQVAIHGAVGASTRAWLGAALGSLFTLTAAATGIAFAVLAGLYIATHGAPFGGVPLPLLMIGLIAVPCLIWEAQGSSLLMAVDRLDLYNRGQILGKLAALLLIVVAVPFLGGGVAGALLGIVAGHAIIAGFGTGTLVRMSRAAGASLRPRGGAVKSLLAGGAKLHVNAVGTLLFASAEILILQYHRGPTDTGIYQMAQQLMMILLVLPQSLGMVLYGRTVRKGADDSWAEHRKSLGMLAAILLVALPAAALAAPFGIPLLAGEAFAPAVPLFQIMLLTVPAKALSIALAPQWIGRGLFLPASLTTVAVGGLNTGLCLLLIPAEGIRGALTASLITSGISLAIGIFMLAYFGRKARMGGLPK